jgi:hypothetical protein
MLEEMISDLGDSCVAIHPRLVGSLRSLLNTAFIATRGDKVRRLVMPSPIKACCDPCSFKIVQSDLDLTESLQTISMR